MRSKLLIRKELRSVDKNATISYKGHTTNEAVPRNNQTALAKGKRRGAKTKFKSGEELTLPAPPGQLKTEQNEKGFFAKSPMVLNRLCYVMG